MVEPTPDTAMAVLAMAMVVLATDMAVLTPDTAMAVWATVMVVWAMDMAAMARGLPTLRPTLITATVALTPDTAMAVLATDMAGMARGLLTLRLTLTTAMVVFTPDTASVLRTPMPTTAMAVTDLDTPLAMVMVDTATSDKSAKGWCRELQPMKRCSISKLEI